MSMDERYKVWEEFQKIKGEEGKRKHCLNRTILVSSTGYFGKSLDLVRPRNVVSRELISLLTVYRQYLN